MASYMLKCFQNISNNFLRSFVFNSSEAYKDNQEAVLNNALVMQNLASFLSIQDMKNANLVSKLWHQRWSEQLSAKSTARIEPDHFENAKSASKFVQLHLENPYLGFGRINFDYLRFWNSTDEEQFSDLLQFCNRTKEIVFSQSKINCMGQFWETLIRSNLMHGLRKLNFESCDFTNTEIWFDLPHDNRIRDVTISYFDGCFEPFPLENILSEFPGIKVLSVQVPSEYFAKVPMVAHVLRELIINIPWVFDEIAVSLMLQACAMTLEVLEIERDPWYAQEDFLNGISMPVLMRLTVTDNVVRNLSCLSGFLNLRYLSVKDVSPQRRFPRPYVHDMFLTSTYSEVDMERFTRTPNLWIARIDMEFIVNLQVMEFLRILAPNLAILFGYRGEDRIMEELI